MSTRSSLRADDRDPVRFDHVGVGSTVAGGDVEHAVVTKRDVRAL